MGIMSELSHSISCWDQVWQLAICSFHPSWCMLIWSLMCFSSFHWVQAFQAFSTRNFDRPYQKLYKNQQNKCIGIVSSGILTSIHVFRIKIQSAVLPNWASGMRLSIAHHLILVIKTMRFLSIAQSLKLWGFCVLPIIRIWSIKLSYRAQSCIVMPL